MESLARVPIAHLPTPIEELRNLSSLFGDVRIFVKHDDMTGLAFGGNKIRKLECLLAEAKAAGAKTLITTGAAQSNHCRQTAAVAAHYGMECILVLSYSSHKKDIELKISGNLLINHLLGAEIVWTSSENRDQVLEHTFLEAKEDGREPYLIPYGGSNPTGASAYVYAMEEMIAQFQNMDPSSRLPDWIVFPSSSGGTQSGMVVGARLFGFDGQVLGISVDQPAEILGDRILSLAMDTAIHLGLNLDIDQDQVIIKDDYIGGGYGVLGDAEKEAIHLFARREGLLLDPVYTARAAAGMLDLIRMGFFRQKQGNTKETSILFWHTGGTPALFAEKYKDVIEGY